MENSIKAKILTFNDLYKHILSGKDKIDKDAYIEGYQWDDNLQTMVLK
jgi:hypothetical protein